VTRSRDFNIEADDSDDDEFADEIGDEDISDFGESGIS
jgi:hypothetical protein